MIEQIVNYLLTPYEKTEACMLGLISKSGEILEHTGSAYERYVKPYQDIFKYKTMMLSNLTENNLVDSLLTATCLVHESRTNNVEFMENDYRLMLRLVESSEVELPYDIISYFTNLFEDGEIANVTGAATATDSAVVRLQGGKPVSGIMGTPNYMMRRKKKQLSSTELTSV